MNKMLRILLIEDSEDDALLEMQMIRQGGYQISCHRIDTEEALLKSFEDSSWQLVISDYSMPNFSGIKALQLVREYNPELPFIFVSGTIGEERAVSAIKNGANDYVNKSHLIRLVPTIERVLREKQIEKEHKETKIALEESKERFYNAFNHSGTGIALVGLNGSLLEVNASCCNMLGYSSKELLRLKLSDLIDEESQTLLTDVVAKLLEQKINSSQIELRLIHKDARKLWVILNISIVKTNANSKSHYFIIQFQDRTEQRFYEEKLLYLTQHSNVTGLFNRKTIFNKMHQLIIDETPHFNLYYLDVDKFKRINEAFGTHIGDLLLKNIANRLKEILPKELIGHIGGNEFLVIDQLPTKESCMARAEKIHSKLLEPFCIQNSEIVLSACTSICQYPLDGKNVSDLLKVASAAMRQGKSKGGDNIQVYHHKKTVRHKNNLFVETELRKAIAANELHVYYQPQIDAKTAKPSGMEALVHWKKNDSVVPPDQFIPIAEESNLILQIGEHVLTNACAYYNKLRKSAPHLTPDRISVNLSSKQLLDERFLETVRNILKKNKFSPENLELEITETVLMQNIGEVYDVINTFRNMGIKIAIDDFGIGYSSLGYLKNLKVDRLKIDKSFVQSCLEDHNSKSIITSIISLAHCLNIEVTAEGIETKAQKEFLINHHCDELQGYLFSPPIPHDSLGHFLEQYQQE